MIVLLASFSSFAQEANKDDGYKFTVKVIDDIEEHDEFLLRQELLASKDVLKFIDINHLDKTVIFIAKYKENEKYSSILNKYFQKYKIYYNNEVIYDSYNKTKIKK